MNEESFRYNDFVSCRARAEAESLPHGGVKYYFMDIDRLSFTAESRGYRAPSVAQSEDSLLGMHQLTGGCC